MIRTDCITSLAGVIAAPRRRKSLSTGTPIDAVHSERVQPGTTGR